MDFSPKAIRFLLEALKLYGERLDCSLEDEDVSDDELSDIANDRQYLAALEQSLQSQHDDLLKGKASLFK